MKHWNYFINIDRYRYYNKYINIKLIHTMIYLIKLIMLKMRSGVIVKY